MFHVAFLGMCAIYFVCRFVKAVLDLFKNNDDD